MKKTLPLLVALTTTGLFAGFDFNTCSGSGTFEQEIIHYGGNYENAVTVGEIPQGIQGLKINLISNRDVDIRLYGENEDKIVHWPRGILNGPVLRTKSYQDVNVTYSGYNGTGGQRGHEFISVEGTTPTILTMKAFGYQAGYATVNYSWTGKEGCTPTTSGTGTFEQPILNKATNLVGTIPPHVENVEINLTSDNDLDIQLYAQDGTAIARWNPAGLMAGPIKQSVIYHDMNITWSGYNGVNNQKGHEYITIEGNTTEMLIMKVYGYQAGSAHVEYKWGDASKDINPCLTREELQNKVISGDDITDVNTSCITDMSGLFLDADEFNQDISGWDVSNVTNMAFMFSGASIFNQPIGNWDVSQVTSMNDMFAHAEKFNQPIGDWNVSKVDNMNGLFWEAKSFNQPLNNWDVSNVTYMPLMFLDAQSFNHPLNNWNVSKVDNMWRMFMNTSAFNQDIHLWNTCNASSNHSEFSINSALSIQNRPQFDCY